METKNTKIYGLLGALAAIFLLTGLAAFWPAPPAQAACDKVGQRYCNGNYVMEYYSKFGTCQSKIVQTCTYGCSNGACNSAPVCSDDGSTCNYSDSCDTTGTNNCGVEVSRCNRTTATNANWSGWTDTSSCTADCGGGTKTQSRTCIGTASCGGSNNCTGSSTQTVSCNTQACTCTVRSVCSDANTVYTRNSDCSTSYQSCQYGCSNGVCNSAPACTPVNGACGTNATNWSAGSSYYTGTFCSAGTVSPSNPAFPVQGGSTTWNCNGNSCGSSVSCTAYRKLPAPTVGVSPTTVASGANVTFSWSAITNASYYNIQYRRDGNWGSWVNVGSNTSTNYSASGLSQSIAAQTQACNQTTGCSLTSNTATATIAPVPTADIKANSSDGPISINYNTSANLTWSSTNASSCSVSPGGWTGTYGPGQSTGNLTSSQTYTLSCSGTGGTANPNSVTVNVAAPTLIIDGFTASPSTGTAPLSGVDFTVSVGGNAIGSIIYQIDCTNNGSYERDISSNSNPYTIADACDYAGGGNYTVKAAVTRSGVTVSQILTLSISHQPVTADIKAQYGSNPASDTPINVPVGANFTLSWTATGATSCRTGSGGTWSSGTSLSLQNGAGSMVRTMGSGTESYPINCTGPGGSMPDSVTVNPVPVTPANLRVTSASPYVKGNTIAFAWDAAPAASFYNVTFYANGNNVGQSQPSPAYGTAISYSNTANINTLGLAVTACRSSGICSAPTAILTVNLSDPTPANTTSTSVNTTSGSTSGYSGSLDSPTDVQYIRLPTSTSDQVYRLQTSGSITPTMAIVDANGNNIVPASASDIQISGSTATFKVPANAAYYVKFTGASGSFTYTFKRFRNFPYYEGQ